MTRVAPAGALQAEPASFRDPRSRVFEADGQILRALTDEGLADWNALGASTLARDLTAAGKLIPTERVADGDPLLLRLPAGYAALLRHERVPFVSYPYEWSFGMLRDAALLQLDLVEAALEERLMLKDSSPYNVQWRGAGPVFVDIGSFERLVGGEPWVGYRQYCMLYLYPLMLQAFKGIEFNAWLRGSLEGIPPGQFRSVLSVGDLLRPGVATHVVLHARLDRRQAARSAEVKAELRAAGWKSELIRANVRRLRKIVSRLEWRPRGPGWTRYADDRPYTDAAATSKDAFVAHVMGTRRWRSVWDLGCNDGRFARIAASHADHVLAVDSDPGVVEQLYRELAREGERRILPLVIDLADPSPGLGWRGVERKPLDGRGSPDLVLCLALLHHLVISANLPLREIVAWLRSLGAPLLVEFAAREDPMVRRLLAGKRADTHPDYRLEVFEEALRSSFRIERREPLDPGTRTLFFAIPE